MKIEVSLNGVDLVVDRDYYVRNRKIVLRFSRPRPRPLHWWENLWLCLTFRCGQAFRLRLPQPDLVVIENWERGYRETLITGTPEFNRYVSYFDDPAN